MNQLSKLAELMPSIAPAIERTRFGAGLADLRTIETDADTIVSDFAAALAVSGKTRFAERSDHREQLENVVLTAADLSRLLLAASDDRDLAKAKASIDELKKSCQLLFRSIRGHTETWVDREFGPLRTYGELLQKIPYTEMLGKAYQQCHQEALLAKASRGLKDLNQIVVKVCDVKDALDAQRKALSEIPGVGDFLNAIAENRATLADLTPDVLKWLVSTGSLTTFSVQPRRQN